MPREHTIHAGSAHAGASFLIAVAATATGQRDVTWVENHGETVAAIIPAAALRPPPAPGPDGWEADAAVRAAGRLAALAMARAAVEGMFSGATPEEGMAAASLFLAGQPDAGDPAPVLIPDRGVWLFAALGQVCAASLHRWAAARAGRDPTLDEVLAVCDELETALLTAGA